MRADLDALGIELVAAAAGRLDGLGTWLDNVRKRAAKLPEQRRADLGQLGMRC
ncbi:hypothetical protein SAMN02787144_10592 [Streptomyces atratus]|uniref:Uncharacterized protein n=1 Tax=Streptomyces atratus TaxID=1893 RepID=A0A1K2FBC1_STRAR|nr:hypothetical protein SAMN02787144_10592 [Streptomyces atratus]